MHSITGCIFGSAAVLFTQRPGKGAAFGLLPVWQRRPVESRFFPDSRKPSGVPDWHFYLCKTRGANRLHNLL